MALLNAFSLRWEQTDQMMPVLILRGINIQHVPQLPVRGTDRDTQVGTTNSNEIQLGAQGRVVIPAALRKALHLKQGDHLIARKVGDSLVLERREAIEKRLADRFRHIPQEVSLSDELIAERRAEAAREERKE
jgi:AbrB family looped-hinge helix DNA binding protein